eukprot:g5230.t1
MSINPRDAKLSRWDPRDHKFLTGVLEREYLKMGSLKQKMMKNKNYKVKQPWSPATDRGKVNKSSIDYKLKWPHLDSSRQAQKLIQSKRVVKKDRPPETLKYRPNGCDQWFAHVGTPPPSVRLTSRTGRSGANPETNRNSIASQRSNASLKSSTRSEGMTGRQSTARSTNSLYDWERSSAELWDRKLQLERELKAVEEQQTELLGNHVVRMNDLMFKREPL